MSDTALWCLGVYTAAVVFLATVMIALSHLLGERHQERATGEPYESGIVQTGSARLRFSARFYLMAMFFVIFDLEAVFLFAWAIAVPETGWAGYMEALLFVAILLAALLYLWRAGALDWGTSPRPAGRSAARDEPTFESGAVMNTRGERA